MEKLIINAAITGMVPLIADNPNVPLTPAEIVTDVSRWPQRVVILSEATPFGGDFGLSFAAGLSAHGCTIEWASRDADWNPEVDLILGYGPFTFSSSMLPAARRLLQRPRGNRPLFAWWLTEGIPDPRVPIPLVQLAARLRLALDRRLTRGSPQAATSFHRRLIQSLRLGHRLRVLGELRWLSSHGVLDVLAVTSASRAAYLQRHGLAPITVPLGYDAHYGTDLHLTRDIDVCVLGDLRATRRAALLERVKRQLHARGIGVSEQTNLYGDARTEFLNRTKVLLNILRAPQDYVGQRFLLSAANKSLVVSEPLRDNEPFVPGRHLVVAPLERLAETVEHYVTHAEARTPIVDEAYRFVTQELTVSQMVGRILAHARLVRRAHTLA